MIEYTPIGIPGGGFITKGLIIGVFAFTAIYYFRDKNSKKTEV